MYNKIYIKIAEFSFNSDICGIYYYYFIEPNKKRIAFDPFKSFTNPYLYPNASIYENKSSGSYSDSRYVNDYEEVAVFIYFI